MTDHRKTEAWRRARRSWLPLIAAGSVTCRRCQQPIHPSQPWDLGHHDDTPARDTATTHTVADLAADLAPEHRRCNRAANRRDDTRATAAPNALWPGT